MPILDHSIPRLNRKALQQRGMRADSVRLVVALTEPAQVCLNLRQHRILLHKRIVSVSEEPVSVESNVDLCRLQTAYCAVADRLLRLAKVPQAPSGASATPPEARPTLDIYPESLHPGSPAAQPSPVATPDVDSPI